MLLRLYFLQISEILNSVECLIIGVVIVICAVYCGAAKVNYIITLDLEIHVLEANLSDILVSAVDKIAYHSPALKIA